MLGTLFFAASLTPTLLPRSFLIQGVLSGASMAVGYGVGVFIRWLWNYMGLPLPGGRVLHMTKLLATAICAVVVVTFLWHAAQWQNSIRELMKLEPVDSAHPLEVGLIALATFIALVGLARAFEATLHFISRRTGSFLPRRVANVVAAVAAVALFWSVINGVLFRAALHFADASYEEYDALIDPETSPPSDTLRAGSSASLIDWEELGRRGREFVSTGPSASEIAAFTGKPALEPIRVYVGRRSAETPEERAELALEELKRVGAFEREALIIVTPTGTGWVDPAAMTSVEYLLHGNVASVAVQYSYLASWLSLLTEPGYGTDVARALFRAVYAHWTTLPKDSRPRLYLHGLSLGAMDSEQSTDLIEVLGDPYDGALWSGPPFSSRLWRWTLANRQPGSPAWLPRFRNGSFVRFMNQNGVQAAPGATWGPVRTVFLQYASDPITFFDYRDIYRQPDWMTPPRGPDVSPELRWYPLVTFLQLGVDMAMATTTPMGYGHVFAPEHYVDAWIEVLDAGDWPAEAAARLKDHLRDSFRKS